MTIECRVCELTVTPEDGLCPNCDAQIEPTLNDHNDDMHWLVHKLESMRWKDGARWIDPDEHAELVKVATAAMLAVSDARKREARNG